jgi:hypothetical protein
MNPAGWLLELITLVKGAAAAASAYVYPINLPNN